MDKIGRRIRCKETGELFRTQTQVADKFNLSYYQLNAYFMSLLTSRPRSDIHGHSFEYIDVDGKGNILEDENGQEHT